MLDPAFVRMAREAPYLAADEERDLIRRALTGEQRAKDALFASHYRVVIKEAQKRRGYTIPIADLVQEGVAGMSEALRRFDPANPGRFATYATYWIKAAMNEAAMRDHSIVRRNTTATDKALFFKLRVARAELERSGRLSEGQIDARLSECFGTTVEAIVSMTAYLCQGDKALNAPVSSDECGIEIIDTLVDEDGPRPDAVTETDIDGEQLRGAIAVALATLNERERAIILARRYMPDPEESRTLDDLAATFGITRERVRQIEARALERLRAALAKAGVGPDALAA